MKPGIRVTLDMGNSEIIQEGKGVYLYNYLGHILVIFRCPDFFVIIIAQASNYIKGKVVSPKTPREEAGLYWGYQIRIADSISKVFTECTYPVS